MKYTTLLILALVLCGCGQKKKNAEVAYRQTIADYRADVEKEELIRAKDREERESKSRLSFMKNHIDKYPHDIDLFNIPVIRSRLQNLTGDNFEQISKCHVESDIETWGDDFIHVSVCFPHECNKVFCEIYLNYITDNISLYYRNYNKHYYLSENGVIGEELEQWRSKK